MAEKPIPKVRDRNGRNRKPKNNSGEMAERTPKRRQRKNNQKNNNQRSQRKKRPVIRGEASKRIPPLPKNTMRVIVLGGAEEVGRNMTLIEYNNDIILIDCGLHFPEEDMPGIDYVIPNVNYLKGKEDKVRALIVTHGHYDHIGGIPHIIPKLKFPPVLGTKLTIAIIKKRQNDFEQQYGKITTKVIDPDQAIRLGELRVEFFRVNHNIPDCVGVVVHSPDGTVMHTGDMKFDYNPVIDPPADLQRIAEIGANGVDLLISDSTNVSLPGQQISETSVQKDLDEIFRKAEGRIVCATFSSLLSRVQQILWLANTYNRKVVVQGFSMKSNVEIAQQLKYMDVPKGILISPHEANRLPDNKVVIMGTGAQGEDNAMLMKMVNKEHRFFQVQRGDSIIFSSSVVPGNERSVVRLRDALLRAGAKVFHYAFMDIHAGGHMKAEDLKLLYNLVNPKYIAPAMGEHYMLRSAEDIARQMGWDEECVFVSANGQIIEMKKQRAKLTPHKVPTSHVFVDGLGVGDVSHVVLRDRQQLADEGMVVVIATVDSKTGAPIGEPDILSRGFVYMKNSHELIDQAKREVMKILKSDKNKKSGPNETYLRNRIRDDLGQFLFMKTERRPMIMPVVIDV